jgi:hypothetical protein
MANGVERMGPYHSCFYLHPYLHSHTPPYVYLPTTTTTTTIITYCKAAMATAYLFKVPEGGAKGADPGFFHQMVCTHARTQRMWMWMWMCMCMHREMAGVAPFFNRVVRPCVHRPHSTAQHSTAQAHHTQPPTIHHHHHHHHHDNKTNQHTTRHETQHVNNRTCSRKCWRPPSPPPSRPR